MTSRHLIAAAAAAALAVPAAATANVAATCTTDGVQVTLTGFDGTHHVPWTVTQAGRQVAAGTARVTGTTTFPVATPGVTGVVEVRATWGPVVPRDTGTATTPVNCTPPAPSTSPEPEPTPARLDPLPPPLPVVSITPVPTQVTRAALTCKQLRARGAGRNTLVRRGCLRASSTQVRRCPAGRFRVVVRGRTYCLASSPRPVQPQVTG